MADLGPRRTTLLATAIIGILLYFAFLRMRAVPLVTTTAVLTSAVVAVLAIAPSPGSVILERLAPGLVLAATAAILQRLLSKTPDIRPGRSRSTDASTIFTVERPVDSSTHSGADLAPTAMMPQP